MIDLIEKDVINNFKYIEKNNIVPSGNTILLNLSRPIIIKFIGIIITETIEAKSNMLNIRCNENNWSYILDINGLLTGVYYNLGYYNFSYDVFNLISTKGALILDSLTNGYSGYISKEVTNININFSASSTGQLKAFMLYKNII